MNDGVEVKKKRGRPKKVAPESVGNVSHETSVVQPEPKPDKAVVVTTLSGLPEKDRNKAIDAFEKADEMAIASELKGELAGAMVYRFRQGNREVTGLSYAGVKAVFRHIYKGGAKFAGNPEFTEEVLNEKEKIIRCMVHLINPKNGEESFGIATCSNLMTYQDGTKRPDPFCYQKALSKATRNAMRFQIPEITAVKLLDKWLKSKDGVREINGSDTPATPDVDVVRKKAMGQFYALLGGVIDLNNADNKKVVRNWLKKVYEGKSLSDMSNDEIAQVTSDLAQFISLHGKEKLIEQFKSIEPNG